MDSTTAVPYHIGELVSRMYAYGDLSVTAETTTLRKSYSDAAGCFERAIGCYQSGYPVLARTATCQAYNAIRIGQITDSLEREAEARELRHKEFTKKINKEVHPTSFLGMLFSSCMSKK